MVDNDDKYLGTIVVDIIALSILVERFLCYVDFVGIVGSYTEFFEKY